jgi:hypothetical protein
MGVALVMEGAPPGLPLITQLRPGPNFVAAIMLSFVLIAAAA